MLVTSISRIVNVITLPIVHPYAPNVYASESALLRNDPARPNGKLQASVTLSGVPQNPADFTFEWFVGQNTLPANLHSTVSGTNGSIAEAVKGGGQAYTVKATSITSQCFATSDAVVSARPRLRPASLTLGRSGATIFLVPVMVFTILLRKHLLRGITFGAVRK